MATLKGTIKRLMGNKGFGFIAAEDGEEYFFHQSACGQDSFNSLREGQAVTFDKAQGPKGARGENIKLA
jgi:CspA family cold shock protein